ncbi:uncharacterized protein DUF551 [Raoultella sp. BIGb0138]|uniref:DUF551 domain-containing protein n=1 Tax=Raoultella sp. BIGb0138 TaxID=2485115 RepID=UPI0010D2E612|nr:DUF551 domain-containing protein [Raoultella sp. BIGb0138]TCW07094.1 uncharacterized protein DUF551 [Raoultella sp. BIGb0138]
MTSKLTRDIIQSEIADFFAGVVEIHTELGGPNTVEEAQNQLTDRVLACVPVVDSDPVAWMHNNNDIGIPAITVSQKIGHYWMAEFENVQPLYRHAQPAPANEPITVTDDMAYAFHHALTDSMLGADEVEEIKTGLRVVFANLTAPIVSAKYPERLPCSVLLEPGLRFGKGIKTSTMLAALARRAIYESDMAALSPEEKAEFRQKIADFKALIAQPAPVVTFYRDGIEAAAKWIDQQREAYDSEHGRHGPDTGSFEFGNDAQREYSSTLEELAEGIRGLHPNAGNSPVHSGLRPEQNIGSPAQSPIDHGYRPDCECSGCKAMGRICAELAGWIPVSERMPEREYVLAADFSGKRYSPCQPNTQVGIYADWFDDGNPTWDDGDGNDLHLKQVTHWMPLPAAPQEVNHG